MISIKPCERADSEVPHAAHDWMTTSGTGLRFYTRRVSCPGYHQTLAPEQDRDQTETPDWTPETLHLSTVAAIVVAYHRLTTTDPVVAFTTRVQYITAISMWRALTGLDEPEALTYAHQIATANPPVTALVPPF